MSRYILGLQPGDKRQVDHINHNIYDNRKQNLRICTCSQNNMNIGLRRNNTSGVTGVKWDKNSNKWETSIYCNKQRYYLGLYENFDEAVQARKKAEEELYGEYNYDNSMKKAGGLI